MGWDYEEPSLGSSIFYVRVTEGNSYFSQETSTFSSKSMCSTHFMLKIDYKTTCKQLSYI